MRAMIVALILWLSIGVVVLSTAQPLCSDYDKNTAVTLCQMKDLMQRMYLELNEARENLFDGARLEQRIERLEERVKELEKR